MQPNAEAQNAYLERPCWRECANWHLGLTEGASAETKARYAFVFGDLRRCAGGLIACVYRASEWRHKDVELAARELLQRLDAKRELLLIAAFPAVGVVAYRLTAPADASGGGFSISRMIEHIRSELRGQNYELQATRNRDRRGHPSLTTVRIDSFRGTLVVSGEDSARRERRASPVGFRGRRSASAPVRARDDGGARAGAR